MRIELTSRIHGNGRRGFLRSLGVAPVVFLVLCLIGLALAASAPQVIGPSGDPYVVDSLAGQIPGTPLIFETSSAVTNPVNYVSIAQIEQSQFPSICTYVEVLDSLGLPVQYLPADSFCVYQDSIRLNSFTIQELTYDSCWTATCLVIDVSGSMNDGGKITAAKNGAIRYVRKMGIYDRTAIVKFSNCYTVMQNFTSDTTALINAINGLSSVTNGRTAYFDGVWEGVGLTTIELGSKAVIALTDGMENNSQNCGGAGTPDGLNSTPPNYDFPDDSTLIVNLALGAGIPIYNITLGSTFDPAYSIRLSNATGGAHFHAPSGAELDSLYDAIKVRLCTRYLIRYYSIDTIPDGDCHAVVVCHRNGDATCSPCDTGSYCEKAAPVIRRTPPTIALDSTCQRPDTNVQLCTWVTDIDTLQSPLTVTLFYRNSGALPYTSISTTRTDSTFCATVPGGQLSCAGDSVQYYFTASNGAVTAATPTNAPIGYHAYPICRLLSDTTIYLCAPRLDSIPISVPGTECTLVGGPGTLRDGWWVYEPQEEETAELILRCQSDSSTCEDTLTVKYHINEGLICDDFEDGVITGWQVLKEPGSTKSGGGCWTESNHALNGIDSAGPQRWWLLSQGDQGLADYIFETSVMGTLGVDKVVAFRIQDANNFCAVNLRSDWNGKDEVTFDKMENGVYHADIAKADYPSQNGTWYRVKVACQGNTNKVYVDDDLVLEYTDESNPISATGIGASPAGGVGLALWTGDKGFAAVSFDYSSVRELSHIMTPLMAGDKAYCYQGNNCSNKTHRPDKPIRWAFDFGVSMDGKRDIDFHGYPVVSPVDGVVKYTYDECTEGDQDCPIGQSGFGNQVMIEYATNKIRRLSHLANKSVFVVEGEQVHQGQVLGLGDQTGSGSPAHVHDQSQSSLAGNSQSFESEYDDGGRPEEGDKPVSGNSNIIDQRESQLLIIANPSSGHTPDHQPQVAFGERKSGIHWYHKYDAANSYFTFPADVTARNCYILEYVGRAGGAASDGAVVYDALGGARSAYVVGWLQWDGWHNRRVDCTNVGTYGEGGPNSCLGMPVTNSYKVGSEWRQDFQKGYMIDSSACPYTGGTYPPGRTEAYPFWSPVYSYVIAEAYEKNGASARLGSAISAVKTDGKTYVQRFKGSASGPHRGPCSIVYSPLKDRIEDRIEVRYEQAAITGYSPVYLTVVSPSGDSINPSVNTIGLGASYEDTADYNGDGDPDDRVLIGFPEFGEYKILVRKMPGADSTATYSIGISLADSAEVFVVQGHTVPLEGETDSISYPFSCGCPSQGDIDGDGFMDVFDVIDVIGIAFGGGTDPKDASCPKTRGDVDNNGVTDVFDVIYIIATAFSGGPNPVNPCGP